MQVVIYSREGCAYCDMAVRLAQSKDAELIVKKLDEDYSVEEFTSLFPFAKTVPQIFLNGEHIGGYQDLKDAVR